MIVSLAAAVREYPSLIAEILARRHKNSAWLRRCSRFSSETVLEHFFVAQRLLFPNLIHTGGTLRCFLSQRGGGCVCPFGET